MKKIQKMESVYFHSYFSQKLPGNFGIQLKVEVSCEGYFIMSRGQLVVQSREGLCFLSFTPIERDISHNI